MTQPKAIVKPVRFDIDKIVSVKRRSVYGEDVQAKEIYFTPENPKFLLMQLDGSLPRIGIPRYNIQYPAGMVYYSTSNDLISKHLLYPQVFLTNPNSIDLGKSKYMLVLEDSYVDVGRAFKQIAFLSLVNTYLADSKSFPKGDCYSHNYLNLSLTPVINNNGVQHFTISDFSNPIKSSNPEDLNDLVYSHLDGFGYNLFENGALSGLPSRTEAGIYPVTVEELQERLLLMP